MSAISEQVRIALYDAMNVSAVTDLATGGIHHLIAPQEELRPLVVFQRISSVVEYSFGLTLALENDIWQVKAIVEADSSTTMEPEQLAEAILSEIADVVPQTLTLSSNDNRTCHRIGEIPVILQTLGDRVIYQHGIMFRVGSV